MLEVGRVDYRRQPTARHSDIDSRHKQENEMAAVDEKVKQIIVEQLQVDEAEVTPGASFQEDLGADPLVEVELVMQFEEAFDLQIPDEDSDKIKAFDLTGHPVRFAAEAKDFDPLLFVDKKEARKMGRFIHFALAASAEAMAHSGLIIDESNRDRFGVHIGS